MQYRYWNVMWKYNRTEIFEKPEINQRINGKVSSIFILSYNSYKNFYVNKLKSFASGTKCGMK